MFLISCCSPDQIETFRLLKYQCPGKFYFFARNKLCTKIYLTAKSSKTTNTIFLINAKKKRFSRVQKQSESRKLFEEQTTSCLFMQLTKRALLSMIINVLKCKLCRTQSKIQHSFYTKQTKTDVYYVTYVDLNELHRQKERDTQVIPSH